MHVCGDCVCLGTPKEMEGSHFAQKNEQNVSVSKKKNEMLEVAFAIAAKQQALNIAFQH